MIIDRNRIIISAVILAIFLGGYYFLSKPLRSEYKRLVVSYAQKQQEVAKARRLAKDIQKLRARKDSLEAVFKEQLSLMPDEEDIPGLLDEIINNGRRAGVEFVKFEPQPWQAKDFYSEIPIEAEVLCTYHQFGRFLSYLAYSSRLVNVREISISQENDPDTPYTMRGRLVLVAYVYTKGKPVAAKTKVTGGKR